MHTAGRMRTYQDNRQISTISEQNTGRVHVPKKTIHRAGRVYSHNVGFMLRVRVGVRVSIREKIKVRVSSSILPIAGPQFSI